MVDNTKDNNGGSDFDEEAFDDVDFDTDDLDAGAYDDVDTDADFDAENEDFAEEEWSEEDVRTAVKGNKKQKSLYTDTYKKPLMSFNTMVILGAFLLGGSVLVYTVMSKSAEVASGKPSIFQSMLNIGEVMDGGIFGDSKKEEQAATTGVTDTVTPAEDQGFLDNPAGVLKEDAQSAVTDGNPPMPSPIAPSETTAVANEPLTPMPSDDAEIVPVVPIDGQPAPRGPDEYVDATVTEPAPATTETPRSAEDILKEAMANRQEKANGKTADAKKPDASAKEEQIAAEQAAVPVAEKQPPVPEAVPTSTPVEKVAAVPAVVTPTGPSPEDVAKLKAATDAAAEAGKKAEALQKKIDSLLARVDTLEGELGTVRTSGQTEVQDLKQTIKTLKQDIVTLKSTPAPAPVRAETPSKVASADAVADEAKPTPVPKKKIVKKIPKPATPKADVSSVYGSAPATTASPTRWELRAAQPGKAWVSKPGARDMQGVTVGETLPGVGQITAINYQNGRWTVQGTQGQILQ